MAPMPTLLIIAFTALSFMAGGGQAQAETLPANPASLEREKDTRERISALQVPFIENQGQVDHRVSFYAKTLTGTVFITHQGEIVYSLPERGNRKNGEETKIDGNSVLTETLAGGKQGAVAGADKSLTEVSYFIGNDRTKWKSHLPTYNTVSLGEVYEGIELSLKARGKTVEKLFTVKPGANPREIRLALEGPRSVRITEQGELEAETESGTVTFTRPIAYQESDGKRVEVTVEYEITSGKGSESEHPAAKLRTPHLLYTFRLGPYDATKTLIIDPSFQSTYINPSSSGYAKAYALAIAPDGTVYVAGHLWEGSYAFIARLNSDLTALLQSTSFGGSGTDRVWSMAIASDGTVYVAGETSSTDFPGTAGGAQPAHVYRRDAFVSKFNADLTALLQSTYLGGSGYDYAYALAIAPDGAVYVAGKTDSVNFPGTAGGAQTSSTGGPTFVSRLNSGLTTLLQSTYLGGSGGDTAKALAIASDGTIYVAGETYSVDFPGTAGGAQPVSGGGSWRSDGFTSRLNSGLTALLQSTYLGGSSYDGADALAIASDGTVYVGGYAYSSDFPGTAGGAQTARASSMDVFVSRLNSGLTGFLQSTYLGGSSGDGQAADALAIAPDGTIYVTGLVYTTNFPGTAGGIQPVFGGGSSDVFVSQLNSGLTALLQSTYLGGSGGFEQATGIVIAGGAVYVAGETSSTDFPGTAGGAQTVFKGPTDAFVSKLSLTLREESPPPTVSSTSPANGATDVAVSTAISATFSEAMDPVTITTTTFTLTDPGGSVAGAVSYGPATNTATFTPSSALAYGTTYTATITTGAQNLAGTALGSNYVWSFTTLSITGPGPPTNVTATPGNVQATVCWSSPVSDGGSPITSYTVTASPGGQTVTVEGAATCATITGLTAGISYTFTVTAANTAGTGEASAPSNAGVPVVVIGNPSNPTNVTAIPGNGQATVSWSPPADDGGSPILWYLVTASPDGKQLWVPADQTSVTFPRLTAGTAYTFTVTAANAAGLSEASAPSNAGVPGMVIGNPFAPTNVTATPGNEQATVSWVAPTSDGGSPITGYRVTASPDGQTTTVGSGTTIVTITGLKNGAVYTFTAVALNAVGTGPPSAPSAPILVGPQPGAPLLVIATAGPGSATVRWYPYPAGYSRVISYTVTAFPGGQTVTVNGRITTAVVTGLTSGVPYTFTVQALTDLGLAPMSLPSDPVIPQ